MLFAGWEFYTVKNCDQGLKNATQCCRVRAGHSFFTIYRPTLSRKKRIYIHKTKDDGKKNILDYECRLQTTNILSKYCVIFMEY